MSPSPPCALSPQALVLPPGDDDDLDLDPNAYPYKVGGGGLGVFRV